VFIFITLLKALLIELVREVSYLLGLQFKNIKIIIKIFQNYPKNAKIPEPATTRAMPKIFIKLIGSPKATSPITDAITTLSPMIIGSPIDLNF